MKRIAIFAIILPAVLLFLSCGPSSNKSSWKGRITLEEGITVVHNPSEPIYKGEFLTFVEELSIGAGAEGDEEYMFHSNPGIFADAHGNIYVIDSKQKSVRVFDPQGKYLRTIGSPGQGPGEYISPTHVFFDDAGRIFIYDTLVRRLLCYSKKGEYLHQNIIPFPFFRCFLDSGNCLIGSGTGKGEKTDMENQLVRCDPPYREIHVLARKKFSLENFASGFMAAPVAPDRILWADTTKYVLYVYDSREKRTVRRIEMNYSPEPLTKEFLEQWGPHYKGIQTKGKTIPPIQALYPSFGGYIFVRTFKRRDNKSIYNVFDPEGRYHGDMTLPGNPYLTKGVKLYAIDVDEDGYFFVKRFRIVENVKK